MAMDLIVNVYLWEDIYISRALAPGKTLPKDFLDMYNAKLIC